MRKTIDELKKELSKTPSQSTFRVLTRQEQSHCWGKTNHFSPIVLEQPFFPSKPVLYPPKKEIVL